MLSTVSDDQVMKYNMLSLALPFSWTGKVILSPWAVTNALQTATTHLILKC